MVSNQAIFFIQSEIIIKLYMLLKLYATGRTKFKL